jgi:hypothetical protein
MAPVEVHKHEASGDQAAEGTVSEGMWCGSHALANAQRERGFLLTL